MIEEKKELVELKIAKLEILEAEAERRRCLPHLYRFPFYKWSLDFFNSRDKLLFLTAANQIGKDLDIETEIPTPSGFKRLADIRVGDYVFNQEGRPTRVIDIPYEGFGDAYELTFNDGVKVVAGPNHDWVVMGGEERFRKQCSRYQKWFVRSTEEIIKLGKYSPEAEPRKKNVIPICGEAKYQESSLWDPYAIGFLIGNGTLASKSMRVTINALDEDVRDYFLRLGAKQSGKPIDYALPLWMKQKIRAEGLTCKSQDKFIPDKYKLGSVEERKLILAGLMDSDGTASELACTYDTSSPRLAADVAELVCSLGGIAQIKVRQAGYKKNGVYKRCLDSHRVSVWLQFNPFISKRKSARWPKLNRDKHQRVIDKIEKVAPRKTKCLTVECKSGTFLCTRGYVVTHNSSSQIRKSIEWATNTDLWPELWPHRTPSVFWYLYPTLPVGDLEIRKKWIPEFLPSGRYKDDPRYGWKTVKSSRGLISEIQFNSGVSIVMKSYETDVDALQSGTVDYLAFDEELPVELWPELQARVRATKGYISGVFTPTKSQQFWFDVMEGREEKEKLPFAHKITASLFDCLNYSDGRPSFWTKEDIERIIAESPTDDEVQRRVYGRFIVNKEMLRYPSFNESVNVGKGGDVPHDWLWFAGIDSGSGTTRDPACIVFVAVRPDYRFARVAKIWVGTPENVDGDDKSTTAADVLKTYIKLKVDIPVIAAYFDSQDVDMGIIAQREGIPLIKAQKARDLGDSTLNSLFKNKMLEIDPVDGHKRLIDELVCLRIDHSKKLHRQTDDVVDSLRYATVLIPWDFAGVIGTMAPVQEKRLPTTEEMNNDRSLAWDKPELEHEIEKEIEEVNREYEGY